MDNYSYLSAWTYSDNRINDLNSTCVWIQTIAKASELKPKQIILIDSKKSFFNNRWQYKEKYDASINVSEIYTKIIETNSDIVYLTLEYKGKTIVIGIDLVNNTFSIAVKNIHENLIEDIESILELTKSNKTKKW